MGAVYYKDFDYKSLSYIKSLKKRGYSNDTFCPCYIMADTETSKKSNGTHDNHVCAFSVAIRYKGNNKACLFGYDPIEFIECISKILDTMQGHYKYVYFHNLAFDYQFLRKFLYKAFGIPKRQLNTKSHYPIYIEFTNGLVLRDSLVLAQRKLEKWSNDLDVEHKKAVGKWQYEKIRNQHENEFTEDEILYISNDVLAGVECLEATAKMLHKNVASMPWTATGIPRDEITKLSKSHNGHEDFLRVAPSYELYIMLEKVFHGGYTHGNRYYYQRLVNDTEVVCYDFASSYPFILTCYKMPISPFYKTFDRSIDMILKRKDKYAFCFNLIMVKPRLKDYYHTVMPVLQLSKCDKVINPILDNGRILEADYVSINITEQDLEIIEKQYTYDKHICTNVWYSHKGYLPRYFTDYIYNLFIDKTMLKGKDKILYQIQKAKLNSIYGMTATKNLRSEIVEDYETGEYNYEHKTTEEDYKRFINRKKSFMPYFWGVWCTAYALNNLFKLSECIDYDNGGVWLYSDTDSIYATHWNEDKVKAYNEDCIAKLKANGYGPVNFEGKDYYLGVATVDGRYKEFKYTGAKRYCKRDLDGKLTITVAGVPKAGVASLEDDINNFKPGLCFDGLTSGKLQHEYIYVDEIYEDEQGNITGDSINLSPCDYILDSEVPFDLYDTLPGYYE